jgi:hypothetical protein
MNVDFSSVAGVVTTLELATPLNYQYPDNIQAALMDLNDPLTVIPALQYGIDALNETINEYIYPNLIESPVYQPVIFDRENYPYLYDRLTSTPTRITYTEFADFLDYSSYENTEQANYYTETNQTRILTDLNYYYENEMSGSSVSLCSLLENPFAKVAGLIENVINIAKNPLDFLPAIASRIKAFAEQMKAMVENIAKGMINLVENIGKKLNNMVGDILNGNVLVSVSAALQKRFSALKSLFSEASMENLKTGIDKFVTKAVAQFQKILENPQVILYLLYMFCKTSSFIESALKNPVQALQGMISNIQHENNLLQVKSAPATQRAINAGRPVATPSSLRQTTEAAKTAHNNAVAATPAAPSDATKIPLTRSYATHPDPSAWSNLAFAGSVINNQFWKRDINITLRKQYGGGTYNVKSLNIPVDIGYHGCELEVLEMMNEVGKTLGRKLTINSAYRHPLYNQHIGGAAGSMHMKGKALDVAIAGRDRALFIQTCKRIGFRGFGTYPSFTHADTGNARSW